MSHNIGCDRRHFLGAALAAFGVLELVANRSDSAHSGSGTPAVTTNGIGTSDSLGTLKEVAAGVLNVGYADAGSPRGRPVILLHGWSYDIHSFADMVPLLASAGYRVIVPYLRGYGTTSFLSSDTFRNGQQAAAAAAIISVMIVAIATVHWSNGLLALTNEIELPLLYLTAAVSLALTGPGAYSIDSVLGLNQW